MKAKIQLPTDVFEQSASNRFADIVWWNIILKYHLEQ